MKDIKTKRGNKGKEKVSIWKEGRKKGGQDTAICFLVPCVCY
jgi:hypothetical protein